jgi:glycosyltransferase involved in cell wall biosynthesis
MTTVAVLKAQDYGAWKRMRERGPVAGSLGPYSIDLLGEHDLELRYSDAVFGRFWQSSPVRRAGGWSERRWPALAGARNALANRDLFRDADVTLAIFENQGSFAAVARRLPLLRRRAPRRLAIVSCWMAERAVTASATELRQYRLVLGGVDRVFCFSRNQRRVYSEVLGFPAERVVPVDFGIDLGFFDEVGEPAGGTYVLAIGRDRGRDHETLLRAVDGTDIPVTIVAPRLGVARPASVTWINEEISHERYREMLEGASAVVVPTTDLMYPTGQTVVLEAMAAGLPVVSSRTEAMSEYVDDGVNGLLVPVGDERALRQALQRVVEDEALRTVLGAKAREVASERFTQRRMWGAIADELKGLAAEPQG